MMAKPLLITITVEVVLLAAASLIGHFFPESLPWVWVGVVAIGVPFLVTMIWRERNARRRTPFSPAARAPVSPTKTVDVVDVSVPNGALVMPSSTPERVYIHRSPKAIVQASRRLTSIAIENFSKPYVGKWMTIEGKVFNVSKLDETISVSVFEEIENEMPAGIFMRFAKRKWMPHLEMLEKGDTIKAQGVFLSVDRRSITLEDCELLD